MPEPPPIASLSLIVAMDSRGVIGDRGALPWRLSSDLRRFKRLTMGHHLLMGRKTWDSIGRPLPGRTSIVISRSHPPLPEGVLSAGSLLEAVALTGDDPEPFVIGGAQIYALALPHATRIYLTEILAEVRGDARFPSWDPGRWEELSREQHEASDRDEHPHLFRVLRRRGCC